MSRIHLDGTVWDRAPRTHPDGYPGPVPPHPYRFGGAWIEALAPEQVHSAAAEHEVAVLAYGSNACPGQLRLKLGERPEPHPVVVPAEVQGLLVTFADLLAGYGSVPATVVAAPGTIRTHVLLLSAAHAAVVDATEGGYHRLPLDPARHPVLLEGGVALPLRCDVYLARAGPLLGPDGEPVPLHAMDQAAARRLRSRR